MNQEFPWQKLLADPMNEATRKGRRALLGLSVVALIVVEAGILPAKIESIGIQFSVGDKPALLRILAATLIYFLIAFAVYAASDFIAWKRSYYELVDRLALEEAKRNWDAEQAGATNVVVDIEAINTREETWKSILRKAIGPTSFIRALVEFLVPIAVGVFAIVSLLRAAAR